MPGRILSKKNESALRNAAKSLMDVLALLDGDEGDEAEQESKESAQPLQERANLGQYLESRIHLSFTELADTLFGDGYLTRDERIGLSSAIGEALDAFASSVGGNLPHLYARGPFEEPPAAMDAISESAQLELDTIPLTERAIRNDGTALIKLIAPGWGSSGYYPREVLERDGPKIFTKGTKQFWNHATAQEEASRPEGDLNALAGELVSAARYDRQGPYGEGLYADTKIFSPYQGAINELAPHIGVSIRASGKAQMGKAEGREGPIIQEITRANSVDYVTVPGAGGEIVSLFESARMSAPTNQEGVNTMTEEQLQEAINRALAPIVAENSRLHEAISRQEAREHSQAHLSRSGLPEVAQARLLESVLAQVPMVDGKVDHAALTERINEAIASERAYLARVTGYGSGRIEGMGGSNAQESQGLKEAQSSLEASFVALGISPAQAKSLAAF